jgi:beta-glucosidase
MTDAAGPSGTPIPASDPRRAPAVIWGVAAASTSTLGIGPRSTWAPWESDGRLPRSADGSGFGVDFRADLAQQAELGLRALRWTLDWSRLEPFEGRWDSGAVDLVTEVLRAARDAGIEVWAVLHEGPLPGWFADDQRGFGDETGLRRTWPRHVDRVAETFGDLVSAWVPVLDPFEMARDGHLDGIRPPGVRSEGEFLDHLLALHLASHEALRLLRSGDAPVVCCIDAEPTVAGVHSREPDERLAAIERANRIDRMRLGTWIRALRDGVISVSGRGERELDGLAGGYDRIGITQRGARSVFADGTDGPYPTDAISASDGRTPWSEGLGITLRRLAEADLQRPIALLGTGLCASEDQWRIETMQSTALEIERAVDDGVDLTHVFWETAIDGWTPTCGFEVPTGFIDRDRNPRPSAAVIRAIAATSARLTP